MGWEIAPSGVSRIVDSASSLEYGPCAPTDPRERRARRLRRRSGGSSVHDPSGSRTPRRSLRSGAPERRRRASTVEAYDVWSVLEQLRVGVPGSDPIFARFGIVRVDTRQTQGVTLKDSALWVIEVSSSHITPSPIELDASHYRFPRFSRRGRLQCLRAESFLSVRLSRRVETASSSCGPSVGLWEVALLAA